MLRHGGAFLGPGVGPLNHFKPRVTGGAPRDEKVGFYSIVRANRKMSVIFPDNVLFFVDDSIVQVDREMLLLLFFSEGLDLLRVMVGDASRT